MGANPAVLLVHDGELPEFGRVLMGLGIEVHERVGAPSPAERARSWDLVIGTPGRLLELDAAPGRAASRIAALAADTRTARAMLARSGVRLVVRLPAHPVALRLLALHALYRGPERRREPRVAIGAAVRIRTGLRRRPALLVDLSLRGCRLLVGDAIEAGRRLSLRIPGALTGGRPLVLGAVAARVLGPDPALPGATGVVASFRTVSPRASRRLAEVLTLHAAGPAAYAPEGGQALFDPGAWSSPPAEAPPPAASSADPVHALGLEAARVLIGRDLSAGGMRVDPHPELGVGAELRLALHLGVDPEPLVVRARVERDEGEHGLALAFHDLGPRERRELERTLALLPLVELPDSGEQQGGLVVSEILGEARVGAAL